ncbi:MAG: Lrp/AsnC family transcriptional regulator [Nitrososphaeraceae archaeon]
MTITLRSSALKSGQFGVRDYHDLLNCIDMYTEHAKRLKCDIYRTVLYHIYCRIQNMTSAFLLINCDFPFSEDVINELGKIPEIVDVYRLHGMYDIIARVKSDTEEELNDVVKIRIRKIDKVKSTITMIIAEGDKLKDKNKI